MEQVRNFNTLKAMSKAGFIVLHNDTKKHKYVNDSILAFEYKGNLYKSIYQDGCFYPFIYLIKNS